MNREWQLEVRAHKYVGSGRTLTKTDKTYYRPPFKVREGEVRDHAPSPRFDVQAILNLGVGAIFVDSRNDRWTRIK